ncbi:MAG: hypothetical protein ABI705_10720 [Aestuariivirga sp.]
MAKSAKRPKTRRGSSAKSSSNGTNRLLKDGLSLASSLLDSRKDWGSEKISEFASATQEYATSMKDIPAAKETITYAADSLENFANYISKTSVELMASDATNLVKRYPVAAITAGITVGLLTIIAASQIKFPGMGRSRTTNRKKGSVRSAGRAPKGAKNGNLNANIH